MKWFLKKCKIVFQEVEKKKGEGVFHFLFKKKGSNDEKLLLD
jgi:hypothetical protein